MAGWTAPARPFEPGGGGGSDTGSEAEDGEAAEAEALLLSARAQTLEAEARRLGDKRVALDGEAFKLAQQGLLPASLPASSSCPVEGPGGWPEFQLLNSRTHTDAIGGLAVSPEGVVAAAGWDGVALLFDLPQWRDLGRLYAPGTDDPVDMAFVAASFSHSAPHLLGAAAGRNVQLWDPWQVERRILATFHHGALVSSLDCHGARDLFASAGDDGAVMLWDAESQQRVQTLACSSYKLSSCRFVGESKPYEYLIAVAGRDGDLSFWDIRRPNVVHRIRGTEAAACLALHAGEHLAAMGTVHGLLGAWDMRTLGGTLRELRRLNVRSLLGCHNTCALSLAVSPCRSYLAAGCQGGELLIFNLKEQYRASKVLHHSDAICALAWGGPVGWAAAPQFLACASLDGGCSCWAPGGRAAADRR